MKFKNVQIRCSSGRLAEDTEVGREMMILIDRVRDIWGRGDARQMAELTDMMVPGPNDSETF